MRLGPLAFFPLLLLASCQKPSATGLAVDTGFSKLISNDTKALVGVDLQALKATPFYRRHESQLNFPMLDSAAAQFGLDPRRDLAEVLLIWNGKSLIIGAKGRFSPLEIGQKLKHSGATETRVGQYTAYRMSGSGTAFNATAFAAVFLDNGHLLTGEWKTLQSALERYGPGTASIPDDLRDRLAAVPRTAQIWEVSGGGLPFVELPMRSDYASALSNIASYVSSTNIGIEAGSGLALHGAILCISDAGAKRVNDALRGGIGLARLTTKDNEQDLLHLYDAIHVKQAASQVELEASVSGDLADRLLSRWVSQPATSN